MLKAKVITSFNAIVRFCCVILEYEDYEQSILPLRDVQEEKARAT